MLQPVPVIYWFRQDLRTTDLPGLAAAMNSGQPVLPCFILDDDTPGCYSAGDASRWWLHHALVALQKDLAQQGGQLLLLKGNTFEVLAALAKRTGAGAVHCSRCYEPWAAALEQQLKEELSAQGVTFKRFRGSLLFEPESIRNQSGQPFRVFTPFWRHCLRQRQPSPSPMATGNFLQNVDAGEPIENLELLPRNPDWAKDWHALWQPGSDGARRALQAFLDNAVVDYKTRRDFPASNATSNLSPHLHFGELSPAQVWQAVQSHCTGQPRLQAGADKFLAEIGWREFNYHLLANFPEICEQAFNPRFADFPWQQNPRALDAWQRGQTGYPIVDSGMRQLWQTGHMHNRVRMICASFLTKHLLLHWRNGERWFWDTLVDADLANNIAGWQWVAGCGADAAPYFRIFNPTLQGRKFDPEGDYVRHWVPELAALPDRYLHEPSAAPAAILEEAGITLGREYPAPIVEHRAARAAALNAYEAVKQA